MEAPAPQEPSQIQNRIAYVKIFPPIGIARVGDSGFDLDTGKQDGPVEWFLPSEIPGALGMPESLNGQFRDSNGRIKRQAVRFRVYGYDKQGKNLGELTTSGGYRFCWTVHVANAKGSFTEFKGKYETRTNLLRNPDVQSDLAPENRSRLIVDPGPKTLIRPATIEFSYIDLLGEFQGSQEHATQVSLGEVRTDEEGRLIFIGGAGYSRCVGNPKAKHFQPDIISEFDSIDWVDDTCDGWVDVTVSVLQDGLQWNAQEKATVLSAPPKFAWGVRAPTTLFDLIENIYFEKTGWKDHETSQFYQDIWPVLHATYVTSWVNEKGFQGHGPLGPGNFIPLEEKLRSTDSEGEGLRQHVLRRLRRPNFVDKTQASMKYMPRLSGDSGEAIEPGAPLPQGVEPIEAFAALTELQYSRFFDWASGNFGSSPAPWDGYKKLEDVPLLLQPSFLTRAALEPTIGDPLYPGIEMHWVAKDPDFYILKNADKGSDPPLRINHEKVKPGQLCRGLSLPWQSDFDQCHTNWWPTIRPDDVLSLKDWKKATGDQKEISEDDFTRAVAVKRKKWTRGLRDTPEFPTEYFPGSTDMVKLWQKLGFVTRRDDLSVKNPAVSLPVWLESERLPLKRTEPPVFQLPSSVTLQGGPENY